VAINLIPKPLPTREYRSISVSIIVVLVAAVYAAMFGNYRINLTIDTPWYLSFSYNYCINGVDTDVTFGSSFRVGWAVQSLLASLLR
jgi:hypothetical protein